MNTDTATEGELAAASLIGIGLHRSLALVLALDGEPPSEGIGRVVRDALASDDSRRRGTGYATVITCVHAYLRRYRPRPPWRFACAEIRLPGAVADLVFTDRPFTGGRLDPDGDVLIDEVKTSASTRSLATARNLNQYHRLLSAGTASWGDHFAGLRIVAPAVGICVLVRDPLDLLGLVSAWPR